MRVAHYCNSFSVLSQTFIYDVITELESQHADNIVFANKRENQKDRPFDKVETLQIKPAAFVSKKINNLLVRMGVRKKDYLKLKQRQQALYGLLKKYKPDVVHCHFGPQGCTAVPAAAALNIPLVVSFHGFDAFKLPNEPFWKEAYGKLFRQAAAVTVVSEAMKKQLTNLGCSSKKIHVIHVGKRISEYPYKVSPRVPIRKFVSIGRMEEKKGHLDAIHVFGKLAPQYPDLKLKIIGEGSLLQQARELVAQLQLQGVVDLAGALPHTAVKENLYTADAFILCSKMANDGDSEGVPTVLMEAQVIGLPCVSTKHSGIPEVIPEESQWLLAEEGNVPQLCNIIERLVSTPEQSLERICTLGRNKIVTEYNLATETARQLELYKNIISKV